MLDQTRQLIHRATADLSAEAWFTVPAGYELIPLPYQFNRPTQFLVESDQLWVAQLNGGENEAVGQVVRVDLA
ncbi:MAG: hypothetical protein KDE09_14095, partial [Anaerolineales bacterium]|nr:hypothetical protein [Anaerolineales bacterium]